MKFVLPILLFICLPALAQMKPAKVVKLASQLIAPRVIVPTNGPTINIGITWQQAWQFEYSTNLITWTIVYATNCPTWWVTLPAAGPAGFYRTVITNAYNPYPTIVTNPP